MNLDELVKMTQAIDMRLLSRIPVLFHVTCLFEDMDVGDKRAVTAEFDADGSLLISVVR